MEEKCPCKGDYLDKLVQPVILTLLCEGPAHGFKLLGEMDRRGFAPGVDTAGLYRSLQKLEQAGKLNFQWQLEPGQKPRKVYSITGLGVQCLKNWQATLRDYGEYLGRVSAALEKGLAATEGQSYGSSRKD